MIYAARATGHTTTWIEWNMPMAKVRQAASIYLDSLAFNSVEMRAATASGGDVDPEEYRLVMGEQPPCP